MTRQYESRGQPSVTRRRNSIPVLVVVLGPAREFLIALAVFALWIIVAMLIAFLAFG